LSSFNVLKTIGLWTKKYLSVAKDRKVAGADVVRYMYKKRCAHSGHLYQPLWIGLKGEKIFS